ncbi:MAG: hypothetical protein LBV41_09420 [Cytophagaceae bacterium]|jgi:hypothetical protein|nr:hypothetical protein [Cytophagaceae bacterium]
MKKLFLFALAGLAIFSCKKDESYARFEPDSYLLHYDETVELNLVSSESNHLFSYFQDADNIEISSDGVVKGKYVGELTVVAKYNDLSAQCYVNVEPYENLYRMAPLIERGMNRETIKSLETGMGRDTLASSMPNVLTIQPSEDKDRELRLMEYMFENNRLIAVVATLRADVNRTRIDKFIAERYPLKKGGYEDAVSGATVSYNEIGNKIEYVW